MLKSGFRTYPYNTQFGCTSNYFALVSAHSGDFLKVSVGWDVAGRNTSIQVVYESYFRWEAVGQRGESQETQEIQGRVSWSENLCLTCDFFVSFRTSEEQGVTSFVWQIKSYGIGLPSLFVLALRASCAWGPMSCAPRIRRVVLDHYWSFQNPTVGPSLLGIYARIGFN